MTDIDFSSDQFNRIKVAADWIRDLESSDSRIHKEKVIEKRVGDFLRFIIFLEFCLTK
jgi:hypothetical protein